MSKKKGEGKKRQQQPWKKKQLGRIERAIKTVSKINSHISAAKAPNVNAGLALNAETSLFALKAQLDALENTWKPAKGRAPGTSKKIGIGSLVRVKPDLDRTDLKVFKHIPVETFANAQVLDDDGKYWVVKCADNVTRVLAKKYTAKVPEVVPTEEAAKDAA